MIVGVGTDIIEVARIEDAWERLGERLAQRLLCDAELQQFAGVKQKARFLAKRFAAKEAAGKALGTGIGQGVSWKHIEVAKGPSGAPLLRLHAAALAHAEARGAARYHLSLSDERAFAVAFVVLESSS